MRAKGRKAYALVRNSDGRFHAGSTQAKFTSKGRMYTAGLTQALQWFSYGLSKFASMDPENTEHAYGNEPRDMSKYTVVEYSCIEVERTPADKWMEAHDKS